MEFLGGLEHGLRAEGGPSVGACEQGLEFADDLLGGGFRDQVAFDLEFEALLEERGSLLAGHAQDGGIPDHLPRTVSFFEIHTAKAQQNPRDHPSINPSATCTFDQEGQVVEHATTSLLNPIWRV